MSLLLKVWVGDRVSIGQHYLQVEALGGPDRALILLNGGQTTMVRADRTTEIFPDVRVSVGAKSNSRQLWLAFDAPRDMTILRVQTS